MRPLHPCSRRVTAALPPAIPAPTITTTWSLDVPLRIAPTPFARPPDPLERPACIRGASLTLLTAGVRASRPTMAYMEYAVAYTGYATMGAPPPHDLHMIYI